MTAATTKKVFRCAIYTRKSTEHNLDLAFNSLDAQREACEAYIKSQAHEGWRLIPHHYDDGAFSGASLERPALQRLLDVVRAGQIDIVVVYKVDRLTRSLSDFAKLVELFDQHAVSFVSVTQSFNTSSSMGRLTLNVLLSFAQFEREVIGERVRDKIAASKKKGLWFGGPIPLGYRSINKKIVIVPEEAETVRLIFQRYLDLGSIGALVQELERKGIRTKRRVLASGRVRGGCRFGVGAMAYMLKNRFFIGEIAYRGEVHRGEHEPILDRALFDAVQTKLNSKAVDRELRLKGSSAILMGRIFDDRGNRMTPSHSNKRGVRYRYYISHPVIQRRKGDAGSVVRVSAPDIETAVVMALRENLKNANKPGCLTSMDDRELVERYVQRVIIKPKTVELRLIDPTNTPEQIGNQEISVTDQLSDDPQAIAITIPWTAPSYIAAKGILHTPSSQSTMKPETRDALLTTIANARNWIGDLIEGRAASFAAIAKREGKVERHIRNLVQLAFLSPRITAAIVDSSVPHDHAVTALAKALPYSWVEQERRIGLASSRA